MDELGISRFNIKGHFEAPKTKVACPVDMLEKMIMADRDTTYDPSYIAPADVEAFGYYDLHRWVYRQAALVLLGFDLGHFGPKSNGVDGDPGDHTRLAIEAAEQAAGLPPDGIWDPVVEAAVSNLLFLDGVTEEQILQMCP